MEHTLHNSALIVVAIVLVGLSPLLSLFTWAPPQAGDVALVVAPPWDDATAIVTKAELREVSPERAPLGTLVALENAQSINRLYASGAWLVIDGKKVIELCSI